MNHLLHSGWIVPGFITCNKQVMDGKYNSQFYPNLLTMFSAFIVLTLLVTMLVVVQAKRYKNSSAINSAS